MGSLFDDLKQGLEEAIEYEEGCGKAHTKTFMIMPVKEYTNKEIRDIRMKAGMTQSVLQYTWGYLRKRSKHGNVAGHILRDQYLDC